MFLNDSAHIYLKTTETCNLNCKHCFTSGSDGKKIYFNPNKTLNFFWRMRRDLPDLRYLSVAFHGGEPMLAPLKDLEDTRDGILKAFPDAHISMQTNLVYNLTEEKRKFFKDTFHGGFGTSWDWDIRFANKAQKKLWEKNVEILTKEDEHPMTMIVCITKKLTEEAEPIDIINYAIDLGFKYILFERITHDGNTQDNLDILPDLKVQDEWLFKMYYQTIQHKLYEKIDNMLLSEIAKAYADFNHTANRCRTCEQSMLTINADGSISGCPNTAPSSAYGSIDMSTKELLTSKGRVKAIACETSRPEECLSCPVSDICNGDCYKLPWDNGYCSSPKTILKYMKKTNDLNNIRKLIMR